MEGSRLRSTVGGEECTTTGSFADHDIDDGSALVQRTYYRLAAAERTEYEPTESFFDGLESAFIWAYLGTVEESGIPTHVEAAIEALARNATAYAVVPAGYDRRIDGRA